MITNIQPIKKHKYSINSAMTEDSYILASTHLNRTQSIKLAHKLQNWFIKNNFLVNEVHLFIKTKFIILTDLPNKNDIKKLIRETGDLLYSPNSQDDITLLGESDEEEHVQNIKTHLLMAIKNNYYHWIYTTIICTNTLEQEIYRLKLDISNNSKERLTRNKYYSIAKDSGLINFLNKSTLSQAINEIVRIRKSKIKHRIVINQDITDYVRKNEFKSIIDKLQKFKLPPDSLYFQFNLEELINHFGILKSLSYKLHNANIKICLSDFNCSKMAWKVARKVNSDWIKLKFTCDPSPKHYNQNLLKLSQTISKAHTFGYKVFITQVECNYFAADLWNLGIDYIQGSFIDVSDKELCKKLSHST